MIPLRDENPTRTFPLITYILIAINIIVYMFQTMLGASNEAFIYQFALIPIQLTSSPSLSNMGNIFTSMFMHAGLTHLLGNMLYLWIFGDNIEDAMGKSRFIFFYLVGGTAASLVHIFTNPTSTIPTVGASGAIAAVLGAYLILYPHQKVVTLIPLGFYMRVTLLPASLVLGAWFLLQFFQGILTLGGPDIGGVAFWAHIGGFVAGLTLAKVFAKPQPKYYYW